MNDEGTAKKAGDEKHVLIIEDDTDVCEILDDLLQREGFAVSLAYTAAEGEHRALSERPDLILLDLLLPDGNGHDLLKRIRQDTWGKSALVMLLTNVDNTESRTDALTSGSHEYLVKADWSLPEVIEHIKRRLTQRYG